MAESRAKEEHGARAGGTGGRVEGRVRPFHPGVYLFTTFTSCDVLAGVQQTSAAAT